MKVFLLALSTSLQAPGVIETALEFTKGQGAELKVLFVLDSTVPDAIFESLTDIGFIGEAPSQQLEDAVAEEYAKQAAQQVDEIRAAAALRDVKCEAEIEQGDFVEATLAATAKYAADLLIISRTRQSLISKVFAGSAVDRLLRMAPCEIRVFEA